MKTVYFNFKFNENLSIKIKIESTSEGPASLNCAQASRKPFQAIYHFLFVRK